MCWIDLVWNYHRFSRQPMSLKSIHSRSLFHYTAAISLCEFGKIDRWTHAIGKMPDRELPLPIHLNDYPNKYHIIFNRAGRRPADVCAYPKHQTIPNDDVLDHEQMPWWEEISMNKYLCLLFFTVYYHKHMAHIMNISIIASIDRCNGRFHHIAKHVNAIVIVQVNFITIWLEKLNETP